MIPCEKVPTLPEVTFVINGMQYALKGEDYVLNVLFNDLLFQIVRSSFLTMNEKGSG